MLAYGLDPRLSSESRSCSPFAEGREREFRTKRLGSITIAGFWCEARKEPAVRFRLTNWISPWDDAKMRAVGREAMSGMCFSDGEAGVVKTNGRSWTWDAISVLKLGTTDPESVGR
jgi:hypothetical protein